MRLCESAHTSANSNKPSSNLGSLIVATLPDTANITCGFDDTTNGVAFGVGEDKGKHVCVGCDDGVAVDGVAKSEGESEDDSDDDREEESEVDKEGEGKLFDATGLLISFVRVLGLLFIQSTKPK